MPNISLNDLSSNARDLAEQSLAWAEPLWDPKGALIWSSHSDRSKDRRLNVRNSTWMAIGFLLRDAEGDTEKAVRTIHAIIDTQFDEPGMTYHGTFFRWVGETHPPGIDSVMWKDYDPNWRHFIGLGFATILEEYEHRLPQDLITRMDRSLKLAVEGEAPDRCPPTYSNIALMKTAMNVWVGKRLKNQDMVSYGEKFGAEVHRLFSENDAFAEYNSPTYYGVNLYALGFWRRYLEDSSVHSLGRDLEQGLWRDIARYYHVGLKNLCGPFTRSYGMDLTRYTALVSMHIWMAYGRDRAPFPSGEEINHEFVYGPCFAIYDAAPPNDIASTFESFSGPRSIERPITTNPNRIATAVMGKDYMLGAEETGDYAARSYQFHGVTAHWRCPNGKIGWLRLKHIGPTNARVEKNLITLTAPISSEFKSRDGLDATTFTFAVYSPGLSVEAFKNGFWDLPGMTVKVKTNLGPPEVVISDGMNFNFDVQNITERSGKKAVSETSRPVANSVFEVVYSGVEGIASFDLKFTKK